MMKYTMIACVLALSACSSQPDDMSAYLAKRDDAMAKLVDKNAELEKRVTSLEASAGLQAAAASADRKEAQSDAIAGEKTKAVDDIITDKRFRDLEDR